MNGDRKTDVWTALAWCWLIFALVFVAGLYAGWWDPFP